MKNFYLCFLFIQLSSGWTVLLAQQKDTVVRSPWQHEIYANFYIFSDDFFVLPNYKVNKDWLHLEARYNYEDMNTFSAWFGYNFSGGNKFQYSLTPMAGGIIGNTNGIAPGLEVDLLFYGFEFYTESEYVFDFNTREGDYFYTWTSFSYSPLKWLWFGLSIQRTKAYETDLDTQRGLFLGGGYRWFGLTGYVFNLFFDEPYGIVTFSVTIPE